MSGYFALIMVVLERLSNWVACFVRALHSAWSYVAYFGRGLYYVFSTGYWSESIEEGRGL